MPNRIDLTEKRFGRLLVVSYAGKDGKGKALWNCVCDCGKSTVKRSSLLRRGETNSCGCLRREVVANENKKKKTTHGRSDSSLYGIWHGMKERTCCETHKQYKDYGGRGIDICEEWKNSFELFEKWSLQNGFEKGLQIDRIDNDKGYYPENCRWATRKVQANNKRSSRILEYRGQKKTMSEWADAAKINYRTFEYRLNNGWPIEKALETPVRGNGGKVDGTD